MQYNLKNDGKLHTRFTDLVRATPKQVENIIREQLGTKKRFENDVLAFGEVRHDMWQKETEQTGRVPACFAEAFPEYDLEVTHAEKEFATEIYENIVLHSRPDAVAAKAFTLIDYKTQRKGAGGARIYKNSKQLIVYAWQLAMHNIRIRRIVYLVEIWNTDETGAMVDVSHYEKFEKDLGLADIHNIKSWIRDRCEVLAEGMRLAGLFQVKRSKR